MTHSCGYSKNGDQYTIITFIMIDVLYIAMSWKLQNKLSIIISSTHPLTKNQLNKNDMNILNTHNIAGKYLGRLSTGKTNKYKRNILRIKVINHAELPSELPSIQYKSSLQDKSFYRKLHYQYHTHYIQSSFIRKFVSRKETLYKRYQL